MQQMFGNGFYPPFAPMNYRGMSTMYEAPLNGVEIENFNPSQTGHMGGYDRNVVWSHMQNMHHPMHENLQCPLAMVVRQYSDQEAQTMSTRTPSCSGGLCHLSTMMHHKKMEGNSIGDMQPTKEQPAIVGNSNTRKPSNTVPQASEVQKSPALNSTYSTQGPLASNSINIDRNVRRPHEPHNQSTLSNTSMGLQWGTNDSSKLSTPNSINKRKAYRGDEKSYLKEVKLAISEGRVP